MCALTSRDKARSSAYFKSVFEPILINSATNPLLLATKRTHPLHELRLTFLLDVFATSILTLPSQHLTFGALFHDILVHLGYCREHETRKHILIYVVMSNLQNTFTGEISTLYFSPSTDQIFLITS